MRFLVLSLSARIFPEHPPREFSLQAAPGRRVVAFAREESSPLGLCLRVSKSGYRRGNVEKIFCAQSRARFEHERDCPPLSALNPTALSVKILLNDLSSDREDCPHWPNFDEFVLQGPATGKRTTGKFCHSLPPLRRRILF